jgi:hypothetical protein
VAAVADRGRRDQRSRLHSRVDLIAKRSSTGGARRFKSRGLWDAQAYLPCSYCFSHSPDSCSIQATASAFRLNPSI